MNNSDLQPGTDHSSSSQPQNHSTLIVVQCRYGSSRLPGKALYPLAGLPMIVFLLRRLKTADLNGRIVLATTTRPEDDAVAAWGRAEDIEVVRGDRDDVLARYLLCLRLHPARAVIRVTADNPLTHAEAVRLTIDRLESGQWDYVSSVKHLPIGTGVDGFTSGLLQTIDRESRTRAHREHLNALVLENPGRFRCLDIEFQGPGARPDIAFTVDTPGDWQKISKIVDSNDRAPYLLKIEDAVARFDKLPV